MSDWAARAEREAAALIDGTGLALADSREYSRVVEVIALAWLQGRIDGMHAGLADLERAYVEMRERLARL